MRGQARRIRVGPRDQVDLRFEFDASEVSIPLHDLQMEYRLQTALLPGKPVDPEIELQGE